LSIFFISVQCYSDADCPPNAICRLQLSGSYADSQYGHCVCPEGYEGDGYECIERTGSVCSCGSNAHCVGTAAGDVICLCDSGYHGDGYVCRPNFSCRNNSDCEYNAECRPDPTNNEYVCQCIEGYIKDENDACIRDGQLCNGAVCPDHASCLYDETEQVSYCQCDPGYEGDGISHCRPEVHGCDLNNNCSPDADCIPIENSYNCVCKEGFIGDGYACTQELTCRNNPYLCDAHASCLKRTDGFLCECNTGYNGNGSYCELNPRKAGSFLVASDGASVYRVPFRVSSRDFAIPFNSAIYQTAVGVDVDCLSGRIYWGDVIGNAIKRAAYDGSSFEQFLSTGKFRFHLNK
jgi:nidogen (entactin)